MVKREAWIKTGEYDESFFYGFEDTDWCKRAYSKGVRLFYYPEAEMLHLLHQSSRAGNARQTDFYASEVHYFRKHHGKLVGSLVKLFIIAFSSIRLAALFLMPGKRESRKIVKDLIGKVVRA